MGIQSGAEMLKLWDGSVECGMGGGYEGWNFMEGHDTQHPLLFTTLSGFHAEGP